MIPLNNHIQIEPEEHQDFIASASSTYDEIGKVIAVAEGVDEVWPGDRVYFDSWTASKFPTGDGKFYWLIPYENVKAVDPLSEERVQGGVSSSVSDTITISTGSLGALRPLRS